MSLFSKKEKEKEMQEYLEQQKKLRERKEKEQMEHKSELKNLIIDVGSTLESLSGKVEKIKKSHFLPEVIDKDDKTIEKLEKKIASLKGEIYWYDAVEQTFDQELKFGNEIDGILRKPYKFYEDIKPNMMVLYGATGAGKTTAARLLAETMRKYSYEIGKYSFHTWKGHVESKFHSLMNENSSGSYARAYEYLYDLYLKESKSTPTAIIAIIIDEADTIVPKRMGEGGSNSFRNDRTNEFLKFYDKVKELGNALIILTTNDLDSFDSAARRRCDVEIEFDGEYNNDYKIKKYQHLLDKFNIKEEEVDWDVHMDLIEKQIKSIYMKKLEREK